MGNNSMLKKNGFAFTCLKENCPNSCCGPFKDRSPDHISVFSMDHDGIPLLHREAEAITKERGKRHIVRLNDGGWHIRLRHDRSCPFWVKGLCSINNIKPALCIAYPFYLDAFSGLNVHRTCPGLNQGHTDVETTKSMLKALKELYIELADRALAKISNSVKEIDSKCCNRQKKVV